MFTKEIEGEVFIFIQTVEGANGFVGYKAENISGVLRELGEPYLVYILNNDRKIALDHLVSVEEGEKLKEYLSTIEWTPSGLEG